eukprot:SAG31_NODE_3259_length_4484_cov_2.910376_4_plen_319_part_00
MLSDEHGCCCREYPCPPHSECINTVPQNGTSRGYRCPCDDGFGQTSSDCSPTECTQGTTVSGSDRDASSPCSGITGAECTYNCAADAIKVGRHVCGEDGAFRGGMCIQQCHTVQIDGDCFDGYNGLYNNTGDIQNGQPVFKKHDDFPDDKMLAVNRFQQWVISQVPSSGRAPEPHGICGTDCMATEGALTEQNMLESLLGTHVWRTRCGGTSAAFMSEHITVTCMVLCSNSCETANNNQCEDGGADSRGSTCPYGTDCNDCAPRDAHVGQGCYERPDASGFQCNDYIKIGYSCFEMMEYYAMDCECSCTTTSDESVGR